MEAAVFRGIPVFFRVLGPWELTAQGDPAFGRMFVLYLSTFIAIMASLGVVLAWRNLRLRRGDRAGAFRIAIVFFALFFTAHLVYAEHEPSALHEMRVVGAALADALLWAATVYLVYIALEPYLRRRSPHQLVAWSRLLAGNWRDPMVGRDVLIGLTAGVSHSTLAVLSGVLRHWTKTGDWVSWNDFDLGLLDHSGLAVAHLAGLLTSAVVLGMAYMVLLMLLTVLLRRRAFAVAAFFLLMTTLFAIFAGITAPEVPWLVLMWSITVFVLTRYGLLAMVCQHVGFGALFFFPPPAPLGWQTARALIPIAFVLIIAIWAVRTSVGNQKLFATDALDA